MLIRLGFFLLFLSTGLTVCYSFRLFCFVMCGDFNFVSSHLMIEKGYNMVFGMVGLLLMSTFGGSSLIWLICPKPSVICLTYYLKFLALLLIILGGCVGYRLAVFFVSCIFILRQLKKGREVLSNGYWSTSDLLGKLYMLVYSTHTYGKII